MSARPPFDQILAAEKTGIRRLARTFGLSFREVEASAWLALQRAQAQPGELTERFYSCLKTELKIYQGARRSVPTCPIPTFMNDNGDLVEVEFAEQEQDEIEAWRTADLSDDQEARLDALRAGPEALCKRLGVGLRRGQQRVKEEFQRLADELSGQGQQMDLFGGGK